MRRKRQESVRYIDLDVDDSEELSEDSEEETDGREYCLKGPPFDLGKSHIHDSDEQRGLGSAQVDNSDGQVEQYSPAASTHDVTEATMSAEDEQDLFVNNSDIVGSPISITLESQTDQDDAEHDLSSVLMDNSWYSVKARREKDGLKEFVFICRICDKKCNRRANIEDHIRSHAGIKLFSCKLCHTKLSRKQNLKSHLAKMHKLSDKQLKSYLQEVDSPDPAVNCRELRQFVRDAEKYVQRNSQTSNGNNKMSSSDFHETIEGKSAGSSNAEANQNFDIDNGTYLYKDRIVKTSTPIDLKLSNNGSKQLDDYGEFTCVSTVSNEGLTSKMYRCKTCNYSCVRRYTMMTHTLTHTGVRRYYCEICNADYTKNTFLKIHIAKEHSILGPELDDMIRRASENAIPGTSTNHSKQERNIPETVSFDMDKCELDDFGENEMIDDSDDSLNDGSDTFLKQKLKELKTKQYENVHNVNNDIQEKVEDYGSFVCIEAADKPQYKVYRCKVCSYECTRRYTMKTHAWTHTGFKRFCCILCGNSFTRSTYFRFHLRKKHSVIGAELDKMVKAASQSELVSESQLQVESILSSDEEFAKHLPGNSREVSPSKEKFSPSQQLNVSFIEADTNIGSVSLFEENHDKSSPSKASSEETIEGSLIKSERSDSEALNSGVDENVSLVSENSSKESSVEKELPEDFSIKGIEALMDCEVLQCLKCLKFFNNKSSLKSHVKTHFSIKPFTCPVCKKHFSKIGNMKEHARIKHNYFGPFPEADSPHAQNTDKICSFSLLKEEQGEEKEEDISPVQIRPERTEEMSTSSCDENSKKDKSVIGHSLEADAFEFMDVENLRCKKCNKTYTSKGNLKAHVKLHFNLRPYACPVCKQAFNNSSNMRVHAKKMHGYSFFSPDYELSNSDSQNSEHTQNFSLIHSDIKLDKEKAHGYEESDVKSNASEALLSTESELPGKMNMCIMSENEGKEMTGISFETMAEELWGYNKNFCETTETEKMKIPVKEAGFSANKTGREKLEVKTETKKVDEIDSDLSFVAKTVNEPDKLPAQTTFNKTDYNNMMTDLMKLAGSGSMLHSIPTECETLPGQLGKTITGLPTHIKPNIAERLPNMMGNNDYANVCNAVKIKTFDILANVNVPSMVTSPINIKNILKTDTESPVKFGLPMLTSPYVQMALRQKVPPVSPLADPNVVKLNALMDEDYLRCRGCCKVFANKWSLKAHVKAIHLKGKQFTCSVCYKTFNFKCNVERHYIIHNPNWTKEKDPDEPFLKSEENKSDSGDTGNESNQDINSDSGNETLDSHNTCSISTTECTNTELPEKLEENFESPVKSNDSETPKQQSTRADSYNEEVEKLMDLYYFQCKKCLKQFANKWSLKAHVKSIHVRSRKYSCPVCQKTFNHKCNLDRHFVVHPEYDPKQVMEASETSDFQCSYCKKGFANKWSMKAHINSIHINCRQYSCPVCQKMFNHKCNLERHITRHVGESSVSSEPDNMPSNLSSGSTGKNDSVKKTNNESEVIEIPSDIPPGDIDDLSFDERLLMDMDKMKCVRCGKRFADKTDLREHVKGHLNITCPVCQKPFISTEKMRRHCNTHYIRVVYEYPNGKNSATDDSMIRSQSNRDSIPDLKSSKKFETTPENIELETGVEKIENEKLIKTVNELPSLGSEDDGPVFCGLCGDEFPNRNDLHAHFETHEEFS